MARTAVRRRVHCLPLTKARINLGAVEKRVHHNKEYFILEKDGIPLAGLMDIDEFEDYLELQDPKVWAHIRRSYQEYRAGKGQPMGSSSRSSGRRRSRRVSGVAARDAVFRPHHTALRAPLP